MIMEYKKIINLWHDTTNQPSKFRTINWIEISDESPGTCNVRNQIKFKPSMIRSNTYDYSDAYIHVKWTITVPNTAAQGGGPDNKNKKVVF